MDEDEVFAAAEIGVDLSVMKDYLDNGFDINSTDGCGKTLLHIAVEENNVELIELLVKYGANINAFSKGEAEQNFPSTPLSQAIANGRSDIVELLLNHGAKIDHECAGSEFLYACSRGELEIVKLLLQRGANIQSTCKYSLQTALHAATLGRNEEIVKLFIDKLDIEAKDWKGKTPLSTSVGEVALQSCNEKVVELLLDCGALTDVRENELGRTVLHVACSWNQGKEANLLLEYGASVNVTDYNGLNPIVSSVVEQSFLASDIVARVSEESNCVGVLIKHVVKILYQNLHICVQNLAFLKSHNNLWSYFMECKKEIENLKAETIEDSTVSHYDLLIESDLGKLAAYANNENVMTAMLYDTCKPKFPIYATMLRNQVRRGMWRKFLFRKVNRFFVAVAAAEGNEALPRLPITCSERIFHHLTNVDLRKLVEVCDPFNESATEIYDMTID